MIGRMALSRIGALLAASVIFAGCGLIHHAPTPQQRFIDALRRGNGTEASTAWIQMTGEQRAALSHGIGLNQSASADEVKAELMRHTADSTADGGTTGVFDTGEDTVEIPGLKATGPARLQDLESVLESAQPDPSSTGK
jgi:hypothetical protein